MRRLCLYPFCPSCSPSEALNRRCASPLGRRAARTRCARRPYRPTYFQEHRFTPKRNSPICSGERYSDTSYEVMKLHTTNGLLLGLYTEEVLEQKALGAGPSGTSGGQQWLPLTPRRSLSLLPVAETRMTSPRQGHDMVERILSASTAAVATPTPLVGLRRRNAMRRIQPNPLTANDSGKGEAPADTASNLHTPVKGGGPMNDPGQRDGLEELGNDIRFAESVLVEPFKILSESLGILRQEWEVVEDLQLKAVTKESCPDFAPKYSK